MPSRPEPDDSLAAQRRLVEERMLADLRAGRTIVITAADRAGPLGPVLPELLAAVHRRAEGAAPGPTVPGHHLLGELGRGGMSVVHLARNERLGRLVALKVLPAWLAGPGRARERLLREARTMAGLRHPNIVAIHEVIEEGDMLAIAMEWIDGCTLRELVRELPPTPDPGDLRLVERRLRLPPGALDHEGGLVAFLVRRMVAISLAVQAVHDAGHLHLDIKPSNVLLGTDGKARLTDFGVVRDLDRSGSRTASFAGTPVYAAPEQLRRDDAAIGPVTDVYGLGVTLYEVLARRQPLCDEGLTELLRRIEAGAIPRLSRQVPVPRDLETIVHKAIDVDPARRYPTAAALAADLEAFLAFRPVTARPLGRRARLLRWCRREPWQATLALLLLLSVPTLLVLGGILLLERPRIAAAQRLERSRQAMAMLHEAYQACFHFSPESEASTERLRELLQLHPDHPFTVLAVLVVLAQKDPVDALRLIDERMPALPDCAGVRLLTAKARAGRPFLTREERDVLARSTDVSDLLVVALDGAMRAELIRDEATFRSVLTTLQAVNLASTEANPVCYGLQALVAARAGDRAALERTTWAMQQNWPDSRDTWLWTAIAWETLDPERALECTRTVMQRWPGDERALILAARALAENGRAEEALALLDAAPALANATVRARALVLQRLGRTAEIEARIVPLCDPESGSDCLFLGGLLAGSDPAAAEEWFRRAVERLPAPSRAFAFAGLGELLLDRRQRPAEGLDLLRQAVALQPQHLRLRQRLAGYLTMQGHAGEARPHWEFVRSFDLVHPAARVLMLRCHMQVGDYPTMLAIAGELIADGDDRPRAAYYQAVGNARLGWWPQAQAALQEHFQRPGGPYQQAWIERAWLAVAPDGDPGLRDPVRGLRDASTALRGHRQRGRAPGPWLLAVLAEAQFQNGAVDDAVGSAEQALAALAAGSVDPEAPVDLAERLRAALQRYRL